MYKRTIAIIGLTLMLVWITVTTYVFVFYGKTDNSNTSTPDSAVATMDSATPDVVEPTICKETEEPTEAETEAPTKTPSKKPTQTEFKPNNTVVETPKKPESQQKPNNSGGESYGYEQDLLAKLIYLEAGNCSEYCQWLVGSTAMNLADERGGLAAVAYNYNIFNVAYQIDSCTPSALSRSVAGRILSGDRDYNVKAFRTSYYHGFGKPYTNVDNVYFSTY